MLVPIPIGLFLLSLVFDVVALTSGEHNLGTAAFWAILGGVGGGLLAAAFGLVDWVGIPSGTRAKRVGLWHAALNVVLVVLFAVAWLLRLGTPGHHAFWLPLLLEIVGVATMIVSGWLGGELVDRLGVGVDEAANVDAPSSLGRVPGRAAP
jgi:uncharacterized membrane protein